jgi:hypothetical protein
VVGNLGVLRGVVCGVIRVYTGFELSTLYSPNLDSITISPLQPALTVTGSPLQVRATKFACRKVAILEGGV